VNAYSRAYINFKNYDDVFEFRNKFDGFVFFDSKGKYSNFCFLNNAI